MSRQFLSLTNLTMSHLKQVTNKLPQLKEQDLLKLDQTISNYLLKRKQSKTSSISQESFEAKVRSELISLQEKNEYLLKQLDFMCRGYQQQCEEISKSNQQCNMQAEESFGEDSGYEQLAKELIQQLMPYKKINQYVERLSALKKDFMHKDIATSSALEYFERIDQLIGHQIQDDTTLDLLENSFEKDFY